MAFVTDSNRPQPLWQPPPTACLKKKTRLWGCLCGALHWNASLGMGRAEPMQLDQYPDAGLVRQQIPDILRTQDPLRCGAHAPVGPLFREMGQCPFTALLEVIQNVLSRPAPPRVWFGCSPPFRRGCLSAHCAAPSHSLRCRGEAGGGAPEPLVTRQSPFANCVAS